MSTTIKLLIVEHNPYDPELIEYELKKDGIDYISKVVQTEIDYSNTFTDFIPDVIFNAEIKRRINIYSRGLKTYDVRYEIYFMKHLLLTANCILNPDKQ